LKIEIHLFASLSKYLPPDSVDKHFFLEIEQNRSIRDVIRQLAIPRSDIKLIFLNGRHSDDTDILQDGDRLGLFPPVGGG